MYKNTILLITLSLMLLSLSIKGQVTTGTISGIVSDPQSALIAGAQITITNARTCFERKGVTNDKGYYRIAGLSPGDYEVIVEQQGFATESASDVSLTVAENISLNFILSVQGTNTSVAVNTSEAGVD